MDNFKMFIIDTITNMHVGSGEINFNIVDNEVQRDVVTNFPIINASSLKGALREFCETKKMKDEINYIFGDNEKFTMGNYKFFNGSLLSIPVRSNKKPFFRGICPSIIDEFLNMITIFCGEQKEIENIFEKVKNSLNDIEDKKGILLKDSQDYCEGLKVEGYDITRNKKNNINRKELSILESIFGEDLVVLNDDIFKNIIKELPIIARNKLENGESKNLWYEEVVPRYTKFYFSIIEGSNKKIKFEEIITKEVIQFGANATIGYGYCKIKKLDLNNLKGENND